MTPEDRAARDELFSRMKQNVRERVTSYSTYLHKDVELLLGRLLAEATEEADNYADLAHKLEAERDALRARLDAAMKVVEAVKSGRSPIVIEKTLDALAALDRSQP